MTKFCYLYLLTNFNRMLSRSLLIGAISALSVVAGLPDLHNFSNFNFSTAASAQDFSEAEVNNYARAVLEAEPVRQTALTDLKQSMGSEELPRIACDREDSISNLPDNARSIAKGYCSQYESIVKKYFSSFEEFNQITKTVQNNPDLRQRIQNEMLRLQGNP
ncbi:MAG: hypothetical protein N4J56_006337 [Chroococcidiopsis sp. SAG 2025]|uniref:DUF4168 domain-containing protein n=1 Tax=Chroococcidiopsis sp. SAG 2025 TaxID=171389 RepID=UPI002936EC9F|nr:DUF4168 domain-containing protein [Chroococcidiopsis sp. SAG 2025]MDV2996683.1 hypothetical protein [Chroococcidiopsis sp. SAG 2025]